MEKRKVIGLRVYFTRSIMIALLGILAIIIVYILLFLFLIQEGFILPANTSQKNAETAIEKLKDNQTDVILSDGRMYEYIYFDHQGKVITSSLSGNALNRMAAKYADINKFYSSAEYICLDDGSYWLISWQYTALFTNPKLRAIMPSADIALLIALILSVVLFFLLFIRRLSHTFATRLNVVTTASDQIAARHLDIPITTASGLKEFDQALSSMENMRQALKESLTKQWNSEQQRIQDIAALAHDIKTPLTVISGNTELLLEDKLNTEQKNLTESIRSATQKVQTYITLLQQISSIDTHEEQLETTSITTIVNDIAGTLSPIAAQKNIHFILPDNQSIISIPVYPSILIRALINITENAIRYTQPSTSVIINITQSPSTTTFIITDHGPGFTPEALKHAPELFWQDDKSRSAARHYGMGLAIAAKAAKKHNGLLILENHPKGATVKLQINRKKKKT